MNQGFHSFPRLSLSDAKSLFGLTARALRFYEDQGLIDAHRDRLNARHYDLTARRRLGWIAPLRKVGVSLTEIRRILDRRPAAVREAAMSAVEARIRTLEAEVDRAKALLAALGASEDCPAVPPAWMSDSVPLEDLRLVP